MACRSRVQSKLAATRSTRLRTPRLVEAVERYVLELVPTGERHLLPCDAVTPNSWCDVLVRVYGRRPTEHSGALYLDCDYTCIGHVLIAMGTAETCLVPIPMVLVPAIKLGARGIVLFHNHPWVDEEAKLIPSEEDIKISEKIKDAAHLISAYVLDHVILGTNCYKSIAHEAGLHLRYPAGAFR